MHCTHNRQLFIDIMQHCSSNSCSIVHRTLAAAVYRYRDLMQQPFKSHQTTRRGSTGTLTSVMSGIALPGLMQTPGNNVAACMAGEPECVSVRSGERWSNPAG